MTKLTRGFTFLFQPALPMRGVTAGDDGRCVTGHISTRTPHAGSDGREYRRSARILISTRTPHAGSDEAHALFPGGGRISTRTPHAGSDPLEVKFKMVLELFQPALPMRGVTGQRLRALHHATISTRTPHAGSDEKEVSQDAASDISTRTPHAGSDLG